MRYTLTLLTALLLAPLAVAVESPKWDVESLSRPPAAVEAQEAREAGLQSLYIAGLPYHGRPTKFYAYFGLPADVTSKVPAVVLIHGGHGTARADWVRAWTARGYAALAFDSEGHLPVMVGEREPGKDKWKTIDSLGQPWGGQPILPAGFADPTLPAKEQWLFHAVADAILSVSYLASRPEVDAKRIGIVGISMGSIVGSTAGGLDGRLAFVVPQYIGGNNDLGNIWHGIIEACPEVMRWDPANFYRDKKTNAHWLWINGDNDKWGLPTMTTKSWRETGPNSWMTLLPSLGHGHLFGVTGLNAVREIYAFADSATRGTPPLARILSTVWGRTDATLIWREKVPVRQAQLIHTTEPIPALAIGGKPRKDWEHVTWQVQAIPMPPVTSLPDGTRQATFPVPAGMKAGYINLLDERGLAVSCDFLDRKP